MSDTPAIARDDAERKLLQRLVAGPVSGDVLAREAGLGRAAVWKKMQALRRAGIDIEGRRGAGYCLCQPLDLLEAEKICAALPPSLQSHLESLQVAWRIDSSNSALLARPPPAEGVRVLLAEQQTAGRGRRGRAWASPLAANLYLSLDRRYLGGLARLGGLSLAAGIAVAEALRQETGLDIRLKWPNDLWLEGRKLGGLLLEGGGEYAGPARAVIGVGLNVRMPGSAAEKIDQPWIDLAARLQPLPARNQLAATLLARLIPALMLFEREALVPFLPRWQALDALAGQRLRVLTANGEFMAEALGLAADGGLRVRHADGEETLHSAEVSIRAEQ